ncbi:MAG: ketopantoate reductase family protein, partial [Clostridia bacterium]|nr:ketopantoate reductase family protein [Clostridia bacterium]
LANLEGINVTEKDIEYYLWLMGTLSPDGMPSMRQDGLAKRKSEVELVAGTVRRMAAKHGLPTPVNDSLYETVQKMESEY